MTAPAAGDHPLIATYRVQMNRAFTLRDALAVVPYLESLGISHLYCSPLLAARKGSTHGYDVVDPTRLNPELGSDDDLRALAGALHERGMGLVLDIVPNHMGTGPENPYWEEVLAHGPRARHARWFDVDWADGAGKIVLPVLGAELDDVIARGELRLVIAGGAGRLVYNQQSFPVDPATLTAEMQLALWDPEAVTDPNAFVASTEGREGIRRLLDAQHYRLTFWKCAPDDLNYRRFFDINDLVALRMEDPQVFRETHALILRWVQEGLVDGLRVDHVDGLRDPLGYLTMLRDAVGGKRNGRDERLPPPAFRLPIFVEKILSAGEQLRDDWPIDGTTGYEFLNDLEDVFVDPQGFRHIEDCYRRMRRLPKEVAFADFAYADKLAVLRDALQPDMDRLVTLLRRITIADGRDWSDARLYDALAHYMAALPVYRTYLVNGGEPSEADRAVIARATAESKRRNPATADITDFLAGVLLGTIGAGQAAAPRAEFVARFQQTSGPATAKGVEDTALYQYVPLVSRNEVGGAPDRPLGDALERLHAANARRRERWPQALLCTNTHDTKRSADVRARLDVLAGVPRDWERHVLRWRRLNNRHRKVVKGRVAPDTNTEYLLYQTLVGLWPAPRAGRRADDLPDRAWRAAARERIERYMLKAAREAKTRTSWTEPNADYEAALKDFVAAVLEPHEDAPFLADVARLVARIAPAAEATALARVLLHLTCPGTPDIYQGDESWNLTLVDPDNRRPVNYDALAKQRPTAKLDLTRKLLHTRGEYSELFRGGDYTPLAVDGNRAAHLVAFTRSLSGVGHALVLAPRRLLALLGDGGALFVDWGTTAVTLPEGLRGRGWRSVLSGDEVSPCATGDSLPVSSILNRAPMGLLLSLE